MKLTKKTIIKKVKPILIKNDVKKASLFGSYARDEQNEDSDIDILFEYNAKESKSLFDLIGLEQDIEEVLHQKVDLVTYASINPKIKKYIVKDLVMII